MGHRRLLSTSVPRVSFPLNFFALYALTLVPVLLPLKALHSLATVHTESASKIALLAFPKLSRS